MDSLLSKLYQQSPGVRAANFSRMQQVAARIERELPGVRRADDSAGRETDMAIDHSEFAQLDGTQTAAVVALMHSEGMQATVSSIHINGWYGQHNKLTGALWRGDPFVRLTVDCHDSPTTTLDKIQLREDFAAGRRGCEFFKALLQRIAATRSAQTIPMAY